jgi:hypothetical protein
MTQPELEVEPKSLRELVSQMQEQQQSRQKFWRPLGRLSMIYVFALTVLALGFLLAPAVLGLEPNAAPVKQNDGPRDLADDIAECDPQSSASI